ncbi:MAG: type II toxin-antitoxin system Phd/YefM family antitoxin [Gammaproteobacteria bacterium]
MKTESLREVKNNLSRVIEQLPKTGAVLITKNGRARAVLLPVGEDTDLESLLLSQNRRLWELIDRSVERGRKRGFTRFADLPK